MTCANAQKCWTVYDAETKQFHSLSHAEFKNLILKSPVKITGRFLQMNSLEKIWIDAILNSEYFK